MTTFKFEVSLTDEQMDLMADEFIARYDLSQGSKTFVKSALTLAICSDIENRLADMVTEPGSFFRVSDVQVHSSEPIEFSDVDFVVTGLPVAA
jgi:hypothetical protein